MSKANASASSTSRSPADLAGAAKAVVGFDTATADTAVCASRGDEVLREELLGLASDGSPRHSTALLTEVERAVSAQHYGGLGLGLWIVATVVEAMHGRVSVDSAVGRGSTFVAELPMDDLGGNPRPTAQA